MTVSPPAPPVTPELRITARGLAVSRGFEARS